jgi:uncharacterized protein YbjT (DUF2867 family)
MTVVRASFFAQNFSKDAMSEGVLTGEIPFPAGETAEPFIDADDLADVVVAALTEDGHTGLVHELTGGCGGPGPYWPGPLTGIRRRTARPARAARQFAPCPGAICSTRWASSKSFSVTAPPASWEFTDRASVL